MVHWPYPCLPSYIGLSCVLGLVGALSGEARAQEEMQALQSPEEALSEDEIIVRADRIRGQLVVEQAPLLELDEADIAAIGAGSIAGLVETISSQTTSSRGRGEGFPVILVNGLRIGSFRELRSYPPESIRKVEVLPEEVAQKFGFSPDRRVVNIILKENYASREIEAKFEQPVQGGYRAWEGEFTILRIAPAGRINLNLEINDTSPLTEAQRSILQTPGSISDVADDPDQASYRSLIAESRQYEVTANWARSFLESGSFLSLNATYERREDRRLSGLNTVRLTAPDGSAALRTFGANNPLERLTDSDTVSSSASWNRGFGEWELTATLDATLTEETTRTKQRAPTLQLVADAAAGLLAIDAPLPQNVAESFDRAFIRSLSGVAKSTLRGNPMLLPAGELSFTFDFGYGWERVTSTDERITSDTQLKRGDVEAGVNMTIPLTSRREGFLDGLGSFTLNAQSGFNHLSDFGTLVDWSAGGNWQPFDNLDLQATYVRSEKAPSLANLGNPQVTLLNVPVFDFVRGETVLASVVTGGNRALAAETQSDWRFSANWQLPFWSNTSLRGEYIRNRSRDVTSDFPALSEATEAAFPERITRDGAGNLLRLDQRAVTYSDIRSKRLVFDFLTSGSWGAAPANGDTRGLSGGKPADRTGQNAGTRGPRGASGAAHASGARSQKTAKKTAEKTAEAGEKSRDENAQSNAQSAEKPRSQAAQSPSRAGGAQALARQITGGFGRDGIGRYFLSLTHTIQLEDEVRIAAGGERLDLLEGAALRNFGSTRHSTRLQAGLFRGGIGLRLSGRYTGKTHVNGNAANGTSDLFVGDLARFDLRFFANLGTVFGQKEGALKDLRISLRVDNVFDAKRKIVDVNGSTPLSYQPDLLDPTGRYIELSLRKMF